MMKEVSLVAMASLLVGVQVCAFYQPNHSYAIQRLAFRQQHVIHHCGMQFRSFTRVFQTSSWGDLAAEWAARNRDDSDPRIMVKNPSPRPSIAVQEVAVSPEPMEEVDDIWKAIDEEVMAMQREAEQALLGLEKMQEDIDVLATDLVTKDENYVQQIKEIKSRGSQVEAELRQRLATLSNDFDAYRTSSEAQSQALRREAEAKQNELRVQIEGLKRNLNEYISTLQSERLQSAELRNEKDRLLQDLQRAREDNAQKLKELEARLGVEQNIRTRERQEFDTRLKQIKDEASTRLESTIQKFQSEKQEIERDYSTRLQKVSEDLRVASANLADAQKIIEEKQARVDTLDSTVTNLDDWIQESWYQLNRLQDAVGLPVTPTDENDEIPGVEVLEAEALNLIDHLRMRERYFEDAIFDIQTEMQDKESEMSEKLEKLEKEYNQYRNDMDEMMRREGPEVVRKEMQAKLDLVGSELETQRNLLNEEAVRAKSFMDARVGVERELEALKKEASYVIDELESQLRAEQEARKKEAESAKKAIEDVEDVSIQSINKVVAQGKERMRATEKELSTRVARAEKDLRFSRLASGIFLSVAVTSALVAGLLAQGVGSDTANDATKTEDTSKVFEQVADSPKVDQKSPFSFQFRPEDKVVTSSTLPKFGSEEKDSEIDTSPKKDFYYAIQEKGVGLSGDKTESSGSPPAPSPLAKAKSLAASAPSPSLDTKAAPVSENDGATPRTYLAIKEPGKVPTQDRKEQTLAPTTSEGVEGRPQTFFAIKEEGVVPLDRSEPSKVESTTPNPSQDAEGRPLQSGTEPRTYLAIKDGAEKKDKNKAPQKEAPSRPKVTVDDDTPLIDWEKLTYKWLDEVENIRSNGASSRVNPAAPKDATKEAKTGVDEALNNPLLQQALAPASANDPFGRTTSN
eukprot:scaffold1168_cov167-Amphora_coffeaeformis.AAC.11